LIKKLLPPLTNLIRTTPAMSLLYECINGVIQGGILEGTDGAREGEEIASLCVGKLRGMIVVEGDPNRMSPNSLCPEHANCDKVKYVALLAFNRIVASHPHLVSMHQDVIMGCIDDPDISIRLQALELGAGMVNSDNLLAVVERLMQQLRTAPTSNKTADDGRSHATGVEPAADSDGEDPEETLRPTAEPPGDSPALPAEYRTTIIHQILEMCSRDTYANIIDFEWYIDILVQLVRLASFGHSLSDSQENNGSNLPRGSDAAGAIGWELRNVAVRVSTVRAEAVLAAKSLMAVSASEPSFVSVGAAGHGVLTFAAWIVGEYFVSSAISYTTLDSLIHPRTQSLPAIVLCAYLQAIPKAIALAVSQELSAWSSERKTMMSLLMARVIHFLEPLTTHPSLEVQERSVEFLELTRVASQAIAGHGLENDQGPLLLTRAIPQLFTGFDLNPVARTAQRKVPLPNDLDLDTIINKDLAGLLQRADQDFSVDSDAAEFESFYNERPTPKASNGPAFDAVPSVAALSSSYQQSENHLLDTETLMRKRIERREKNKDDPFYISNDDVSSDTSTPFHDILRSANGEEVDVDSIPIMNLEIGDRGALVDTSSTNMRKQKRKRPRKVHVAKDENIGNEDTGIDPSQTGTIAEDTGPAQRTRDKAKKSFLQVDSSGLSSYSLNGNDSASGKLELETQEVQDTQMVKALAEVERLRLEMQRASERVEATDGAPAEGTLVKKKKTKKPKQAIGEIATQDEQSGGGGNAPESKDAEAAPIIKERKKKKKKRKRKPVAVKPDDED